MKNKKLLYIILIVIFTTSCASPLFNNSKKNDSNNPNIQNMKKKYVYTIENEKQNEFILVFYHKGIPIDMDFKTIKKKIGNKDICNNPEVLAYAKLIGLSKCDSILSVEDFCQKNIVTRHSSGLDENGNVTSEISEIKEESIPIARVFRIVCK